MQVKTMKSATTLDKLAHTLEVANDVVKMIQTHERIGQVNVHSHGPIIGDLLELTRRAHVLADAFQFEVEGR